MKSNKYLKICLLISLSLLIIGFNTAIAADSGNAINKTSVKSSHLNKDSSTDNAYKINKKIQNNTKNTNKYKQFRKSKVSHDEHNLSFLYMSL